TRAQAGPGRSTSRAERAALLTARHSLPNLSSTHRARLHPPNARRIFGDSTVAREFPGAGHVKNGLTRPGARSGVELTQLPLHLNVRGQVGEVHVVIPARQQRLA